MTEEDIVIAFREAIKRAGTQTALAKRIGVSQGTISDYINGRCSVGNMTVTTLLRVFPDIKMLFWGESVNPNIRNDHELSDELDDLKRRITEFETKLKNDIPIDRKCLSYSKR